MAQTLTSIHAQAGMSPAVNGTAPTALDVHPKNGYRFTDNAGNVAYLWWEPVKPVVAAEDAAFRRRVQRALKRPIWIVEDETDEFGVQWSTRKHIQPTDPRYPLHWFWSLGQVGLGNLAKAEIIRRETNKRVWPPWDESTDHLTAQYEST
jgi:hypothetical protein